MKTPLQQLKENLREDFITPKILTASESNLMHEVIKLIDSLLPTERECIINAREDGHLYTEAEYEGCGEVSKRLVITSEQYFNETYNDI
ncbi:MAG TPA: hypothetical protein VGF79_00985 [Bacteroidia bacterium]